MSRKHKKNNEVIRVPSTVLRKSNMKNLSLAVQERFLDLCKLYFFHKKEKLDIPSELDADFFLWRTAETRFKEGDFRSTADEENAVRRIADWTLRVSCELKGQEQKQVEWSV